MLLFFRASCRCCAGSPRLSSLRCFSSAFLRSLGVPRSSASRDAFLDSYGTPPQSISAPRLLPVEVLTNTPSCDIIQSRYTKTYTVPFEVYGVLYRRRINAVKAPAVHTVCQHYIENRAYLFTLKHEKKDRSQL